MNILSNIEIKVIQKRILGYTLQEVADYLLVSRERIRKIQNKALLKINSINKYDNPHISTNGKRKKLEVIII